MLVPTHQRARLFLPRSFDSTGRSVRRIARWTDRHAGERRCDKFFDIVGTIILANGGVAQSEEQVPYKHQVGSAILSAPIFFFLILKIKFMRRTAMAAKRSVKS